MAPVWGRRLAPVPQVRTCPIRRAAPDIQERAQWFWKYFSLIHPLPPVGLAHHAGEITREGLRLVDAEERVVAGLRHQRSHASGHVLDTTGHLGAAAEVDEFVRIDARSKSCAVDPRIADELPATLDESAGSSPWRARAPHAVRPPLRARRARGRGSADHARVDARRGKHRRVHVRQIGQACVAESSKPRDDQRPEDCARTRSLPEQAVTAERAQVREIHDEHVAPVVEGRDRVQHAADLRVEVLDQAVVLGKLVCTRRAASARARTSSRSTRKPLSKGCCAMKLRGSGGSSA